MATYRYHWTPRSNLASIASHGLDPERASGKLRVVWSCEAERVLWAVGHVARHHECAPDDMVLLRIRVDGVPTKPSSWPCVTLLTKRVAPSRITYRADALSAKWVSVKRASAED